MFDRLEDLVRRYEEITKELTEPSVVNDQKRFRNLMKEQSDLQPLVDAYLEYRRCQETVLDSVAMLEEESDEEMREMLKEELSDARKRTAELEQQMKILLLPKDRSDMSHLTPGHINHSPALLLRPRSSVHGPDESVPQSLFHTKRA